VALSVVALLVKALPGFTQDNVPLILLLLPAHAAIAFGLWRAGASRPAIAIRELGAAVPADAPSSGRAP
jgi:hypothetical protein